MLPDKITKNFREISKFFVENFDNSASTIFTVLDTLKLNDKSLCLSTNYNAKYSQAVKFVLILLMPFFCIRNVANYCKSKLYSKIDCGKDTLYRFKKDNSVDFRKINFRIAKKLRKRIVEGTDSNSKHPECLILDDTDLEKTGCRFELLGKIFSHVTHSYILGYKLLSLIYNDGKSILGLDFSVHGEPGKNGDYGMTKAQKKKQYSKKDREKTERVAEYKKPKPESAMEMLKRAFKHGFKAKYVLADSWFCSIELIRFVIKTLKINFLGMAKHGNTKYSYNGKLLTINDLIAKRRDTRTSRQYNCKYIRRDVVFKGTPVTLFCIRLTKKGKWRTIITTNRDLNFERAMEIYAMRWSIEVFFKECKQHLLLNNCQSVDFDVQIADITFSFIRFNILSTILRKQKYDTMGGLFEEITKDTLELTINERIILFIKDLVENIKEQLYNSKNTLLVDLGVDNQLVRNLIKLE